MICTLRVKWDQKSVHVSSSLANKLNQVSRLLTYSHLSEPAPRKGRICCTLQLASELSYVATSHLVPERLGSTLRSFYAATNICKSGADVLCAGESLSCTHPRQNGHDSDTTNAKTTVMPAASSIDLTKLPVDMPTAPE